MNEFCNLIAHQKPANTKHGKQNTTTKPGATFVVRKQVDRRRRRTFYVVKLSGLFMFEGVKKNAEVYKPTNPLRLFNEIFTGSLTKKTQRQIC